MKSWAASWVNCCHQIQPVLFERRVKKLPSLKVKLQNFYKDVDSLDDIEDLVGIRLVFLYAKQVERAKDHITREFTVHQQRSHDFRASGVDSFGYESEHLVISLNDHRRGLLEWKRYRTLRAEVQLGTVMQHAWAVHSHGLDYKPASVGLEDVLRHELHSLAGSLHTADTQFRRLRDRLDRIDDQYQKCVSEGRLTEVELTARSLRAYVSELRPTLEELRRMAERIGYDQSVQGRDGSVEEFVEYARLCGATTLARVGPFARAARKHRNDLIALRTEALAFGFNPAAQPFDLITFSLAFENEFALRRLLTSKYYSPKLRKAFRSITKATA